ncbi:MAG: MBL fold metallo-hydrolase [Thermomicrobiales bacterium]
MTTRIKFLGVAAYEVVGPEHRILMDPFLSGNPAAPIGPDDIETPDVILVSHAAWDHLGDTATIALRTGAPVVCGADVGAVLREAGIPAGQIRPTIWGICVEVGGVVVRAVESHHWSSATLKSGETVSGMPLGFIVETTPGIRVYHCGDSAIFGDMRLLGELYKPTVGLLGCTQPKAILSRAPWAGRVLTGEMSPREAALAAEMLGVQLAIASHYTEPDDEDVVEFCHLVRSLDTTGRREAIALAPGETLVIDGASWRKEQV